MTRIGWRTTARVDEPDFVVPLGLWIKMGMLKLRFAGGKKFRSVAQAEFHGSKTQHVNFSESTEEIAPLTEEEVKEKMALLRRRRDEKNAAKSEEDKLANKRNEVGLL